MTQAELQRRIKAVGIAEHWPYGANNPETRDRLLDWAEPLQLRYSEGRDLPPLDRQGPLCGAGLPRARWLP